MRCDAFACRGSVDSVGAGDSFLAGVVAAFCFYASANARPSVPPPTLERILELGMASALWKVDTGRSYQDERGGVSYCCPSIAELLESIPSLERLTPQNRYLLD